MAATATQRTLPLVLVALAAGCGGGDEELQRQPLSAPVVISGQVTVEGKPVVAHVSLHQGEPRDLLDVPTVDETQTQADGRFVLRSSPSTTKPTSFFVYVNRSVEFADFCDYIDLPRVERQGSRWVRTADDKPLAPLVIRLPPDHEPVGTCY